MVFENLPWQEVLARYDGPQALFYLDPPYWGGEDDYGKGLFDRDQFAELAERLARIKGAFVLSINDRPEIRDLFGAFVIEEVRLTYSVSKSGTTAARELIIANREVRVGLV
ncbi:DNA adenine methylase [Rhodovulum sulfidophilum]|uniref:DNA adenine methylase n=1 Tax=Rhodovulum sulfidophilum TaxID=35806 RepID=UPI001389A14E|nr:DNA adenine methylase [Rhodovulum sulfidophilum]NDK34509.1 DNA adenine methylase [Rhodovulum sulfidophilum]